MNFCDVGGFEPLPFSLVTVHLLSLLHRATLLTLTSLANHHFGKLANSKKVEDIGVEPMTPCVQGRCSSQLS